MTDTSELRAMLDPVGSYREALVAKLEAAITDEWNPIESDGSLREILDRVIAEVPVPSVTAGESPPDWMEDHDPETVRQAHAMKRALLNEAQERAEPTMIEVCAGLGLDKRGLYISLVERVSTYDEKKGTQIIYHMHLSDGHCALGTASEAINQGKVRSALAESVGHVLAKKGEGEWTKIAQAILDAEVACRPVWASEEMRRAAEMPLPLDGE